MAVILGVGIATVDLVLLVDSYPVENEKCRARSMHTRRGGNATNTLVVLSQLGHKVSWAGSLADGVSSAAIVDDLNTFQVDTRYIRKHSTFSAPTSIILHSERSKSRTIVHYRDLPEFSFDDFASIDLQPFEWIHFEGRNCSELGPMLRQARTRLGTDRKISMEIEQARDGIEVLFNECDVLMFSQSYAEKRGFDDPVTFLESVKLSNPSKIATCTWGAEGAAGTSPEHPVFAVAAHRPTEVIDTVGAGDTFNAGLIDGLVRGQSLRDSVLAATTLAGEKCGHVGLKISHTSNN